MLLNYFSKFLFTVCCILLLNDSVAADATYKKLQWIDLMPVEDMKALYEPPDAIMNIPEGGAGDQVADEVFNTLMQAADSDYMQALSSTKVIESLNDKKVMIPGFIVPVVIDGDKTTEFFIVPYFGACIHYPPPPPNQTIYAQYKKGFALNNLYEPFVLSGHLTTSVKENELATSAYNLKIEKVAAYDDSY